RALPTVPLIEVCLPANSTPFSSEKEGCERTSDGLPVWSSQQQIEKTSNGNNKNPDNTDHIWIGEWIRWLYLYRKLKLFDVSIKVHFLLPDLPVVVYSKGMLAFFNFFE